MEKLKIDSHIDLMSSFRQFQSETKFTDLRITAKDHNHTFNCHKLVIGAASGLLASLLKSLDFNQEGDDLIVIPDMAPEVLLNLANFIYGGVSDWMDLNEETLVWFKILGIPLQIKVKAPNNQKYQLMTKDNDNVNVNSENVKKMMQFNCPFKACDKVFEEQLEVDEHFKTKHKVGRQPDNVEIEGLLPYKCTFCDKSFATKTYLEHHMSTHCQECGKKFNTQAKLSQHMKSNHQEAGLFMCLFEGCQKTFKMKRYLMQHYRTHEKQRSLPCEVCQKVLAGPRELRNHLRIHTGEMPFKCPECPKSFRNSSTFNTHLKLHSKIKPHVCGFCNHAFIQLGDLKKHMRTRHTNDKPYSCEECGKKFGRSDYLLKHTRVHRKNNENQSGAIAEEEEEEEEAVNALLSEAMLDEEVNLEPMEYVLQD